MDKTFQKSINKHYDHWTFTQDGKYSKCSSKYKKMRRRNQRAIEKRELDVRGVVVNTQAFDV